MLSRGPKIAETRLKKGPFSKQISRVYMYVRASCERLISNMVFVLCGTVGGLALTTFACPPLPAAGVNHRRGEGVSCLFFD